jgi:hypothetical protein
VREREHPLAQRHARGLRRPRHDGKSHDPCRTTRRPGCRRTPRRRAARSHGRASRSRGSPRAPSWRAWARARRARRRRWHRRASPGCRGRPRREQCARADGARTGPLVLRWPCGAAWRRTCRRGQRDLLHAWEALGVAAASLRHGGRQAVAAASTPAAPLTPAVATDSRVRVVDPEAPTNVLADHARTFDRDQRVESNRTGTRPCARRAEAARASEPRLRPHLRGRCRRRLCILPATGRRVPAPRVHVVPGEE